MDGTAAQREPRVAEHEQYDELLSAAPR